MPVPRAQTSSHVLGFHANGSYNDATGWGTVNAALFVPTLARYAG